MDMITGSIIGATIVAGVNLTIFQLNRKNDYNLERLKNLYNPMYSLISRKEKYFVYLKLRANKSDEAFTEFAVDYYHYFLELRDIYFDNKVYESKELKWAFHRLLHNHEMESHNYRNFGKISSEEELIKSVALFELKHQLDQDQMSEFERNLEKVIEVIYSDMDKLS
jgi:hypothetical protein